MMNKKIKCSIHIIMTAYFSFDLMSSLELSACSIKSFSEVSTGAGEVTWIDSMVSRGKLFLTFQNQESYQVRRCSEMYPGQGKKIL